jgi:hypothetical protein
MKCAQAIAFGVIGLEKNYPIMAKAGPDAQFAARK